MKSNESSTDRIIRAIAGVVLLLIALLTVTNIVLKVILIIIAAVALITAATGFCLIYRLLNISTRR
ncbi:MAG: hypothetical protein BWY52_01280 [Chloroflexi bacterium ADurb.Bin325]|nr:MAG: hypothetical protein BWY52_01280 [Chloroflexi bacterium ADurb.Bin325]